MINITDQRFTRLVAKRRVGYLNHVSLWECVCDCGNTVNVRIATLRNGQTKSCGCLRKDNSRRMLTTHGHSSTRMHTNYLGMLARCRYPKHKDYRYYGGRGITVCERWLPPHGYANFLADMGECPPGHTLDRIRGDEGYSPDNCRWATSSVQHWNRRTPYTVKLSLAVASEIRDLAKTGIKASVIARKYSVCDATISHILKGQSWKTTR